MIVYSVYYQLIVVSIARISHITMITLFLLCGINLNTNGINYKFVERDGFPVPGEASSLQMSVKEIER
jgi:hypothetical protein